MPLYDYQCKECDAEFELFTTLNRWNDTIPCAECGGVCERILTLGHGGIALDTPSWLDDSVRAMVQDLDDPSVKPIETRQELNRYLKQNGFVAAG
jgi:putative FmdB family regulatory protein